MLKMKLSRHMQRFYVKWGRGKISTETHKTKQTLIYKLLLRIPGLVLIYLRYLKHRSLLSSRIPCSYLFLKHLPFCLQYTFVSLCLFVDSSVLSEGWPNGKW